MCRIATKTEVVSLVENGGKFTSFIQSPLVHFFLMWLDISCESTAWQTIHMQCQALFSPKNNFKKFKVSFAAVVISTVWINTQYYYFQY